MAIMIYRFSESKVLQLEKMKVKDNFMKSTFTENRKQGGSKGETHECF